MNLFSAKLELVSYATLSSDTYQLTTNVLDSTGNFTALDVKADDVIYVNDFYTNTLLRYKVNSVDPSTSGSVLVANVQWDVNGASPAEPVIGGDSIIGRKNLKLNTIIMPSITLNGISESLETSVKNFEQDLISTAIDKKENNIPDPTVDGEVLSSTTTGVKSWVALPNIGDAINALKGQPNGLAQLDANGKLVLNEVPSIAITDVYTVADETEMLALGTTKDAERGDIASRTDDGAQYILTADDASVLTNWKKLSQPVPVQMVNGKTGVIVLTTSDIAEGTNLYYTDDRVANSPAVKDLQTKVNAIPADLMEKSVYDTNNNGIIDHAELADVANSVDYANVTNKPSLATVATSGSYNDLLNKPVIPTKSSDLTLDDVYTKTETDTALSAKANTADVYTKTETDAALLLKANTTDVYTKTEVDAKITSSGDMKKADYDANNNGIIDHAELADVASSVDYTNVTNKPSFAIVATSGSYTDLINKPVIPTKSSDLTLDNVYTKTESDTALSTKANTTDVYTKTEVDAKIPADLMEKSVYDTNNSGVVDKAELADVASSVDYTNVTNKPSFATVATSGSYTDLVNKPVIPTKSSDLTLDNVYTKTESDAALLLKANVADVYTKVQTDAKVAGIISDASTSLTTTYSATKIDTLLAGASGSSLMRYQVGDNIVLATGAGVTITKSSTNATISCPDGVMIVSATIHFLSTDLAGATTVNIDFGSKTDYSGTGNNSAFTNFAPPIVQVTNDNGTSGTYKASTAYTYTTNPHTLTVSGLLSSGGAWIKMVF